eukprot:3810986-Pleurochrysis_carterae.AAC.1
MRQNLPPNSSGYMPHAATIRFASLREVDVLVHVDIPSLPVKKGVELAPPGCRSAAGINSCLATPIASSTL